MNYKLPISAIYVTINTLFALTVNLNIPSLITLDIYHALTERFQDEKLYPSSPQIEIQSKNKSDAGRGEGSNFCCCCCFFG